MVGGIPVDLYLADVGDRLRMAIAVWVRTRIRCYCPQGRPPRGSQDRSIRS